MASTGKRSREDDSHGPSSTDKKPAFTSAPNALPFPKHIAYDQDTDAIMGRANQCCDQLHAVVRPHANASNAFRNLSQRLAKIPRSEGISGVVIAVAGECGSGKSMLINMALDDPTATPSLLDVTSTTATAILLVKSLPHQHAPGYAAQVRALDADTLKTFVHDRLQDIFRYHSEIATGELKWSEDDEKLYRRTADSAEEVLASLCIGMDGLSSASEVQEACLVTDGNFSALASSIEDQCATLLETYGFVTTDGVPMLTVDADNGVELNHQLGPFILKQNEHAFKPALWAITEIVIKTVPDSEMAEHISFLDLPGGSDSNICRAWLTARWVRRCTALLGVAGLDSKPASAISYAHLAADYSDQFGKNLLGVITKTDQGLGERQRTSMVEQLQDRFINRLASVKASLSLDKVKKVVMITELEQRLADLEQYREIGIEVADLRSKAQHEKQKSLVQQREVDQLDLFVCARNYDIIQQMSEQQHLSKFGKVVCVSNDHYEKHQTGHRGDQAVLMSLAQTNIHELRTEALMLAGDARYDSLRARAVEILGVLSQAALMVGCARSTRFTKDFETFQRRFEMLGLCATTNEKGISAAANPFLQQHLKRSTPLFGVFQTLIAAKRESFRESALNATVDFFQRIRHQAIVRAFFLKNGEHELTGKRKNLNEIVMEALADFLNENWLNMRTAQRCAMEAQLHEVVKAMEDTMNTVCAFAASENLDHTLFQAAISNAIEKVRAAHKKALKALETNQVKSIKRDATRAEHDGYFMQVMLPMYDAARKHKGEGSPTRMKNDFEECLRGRLSINSARPRDPFQETETLLLENLKTAYNQMAGGLQLEFSEIVSEMMDNLRESFLGEEKTAEEMAACIEVKALLDDSQTRDLVERLKEHFDATDQLLNTHIEYPERAPVQADAPKTWFARLSSRWFG
ncbi:hypothetical protein AC578_6471 [Pseudocercospora eumusae]|uniref:DUF7605 domain-containing protein n=1 Tax=Pseudocercospora eumusae TaxID=321146 RepID=A0A139HD05_9PEZI|nr:hypothetical protein AC578_6471 [Pseudocercospora eumusae]